MYLRPEHFILSPVQVVSGRRPTAGQGLGNRVAVPRGNEAVRRLLPAFPPRLQPGQILPGMCRTHEAD